MTLNDEKTLTTLRIVGEQAYAAKQYSEASDIFSQTVSLAVSTHGADSLKTDTIEDDDDQDEEEGIVADSFEEETPAVASSSTDIPPPVLDQEATQDDQQDENEVDPDDFQIAWEVLEQARLIYEREVKTTPSLANSLANGQISMEQEQWLQAITDYSMALELKKSTFDPFNREVAEASYSLGLVYEFNGQLDKAIESIKFAASVIEKLSITDLYADFDQKIKELELKLKQGDVVEKQEPEYVVGGKRVGDVIHDVGALVRKKIKSGEGIEKMQELLKKQQEASKE